MIALILFTCSVSVGDCSPHVIATLTPTQCAFAQPYIVEWLVQHPDQEFKRWVCTPNPKSVLAEKEA